MATNGSHQPAMQHENTYNSGNDVVESIAGAFGGLFNPAPNYGDENAEAAFQRKLKRRKEKNQLVITQNRHENERNGEQRFHPHAGCGI